ncbi:MAG: ABC transporter permease [bacterium]|nr:ABC transporter permease [bacterium]
MLQLIRDLRLAVRSLAKSPAFLLVTVLTIGLGIGANTAIFSVLENVVLAPLPYEEPDRLVRLYQVFEEEPQRGVVVSGPAFLDYRERLDALEGVAAVYNYHEMGFNLMVAGAPQRVSFLPVSADFFAVYGATPLIGRVFEQEEERASARIAVLSHGLWQTLAAGDPAILGRRLVLDGESYEVVGVMPETFLDVVGGDVDLWVPQDLQDPEFNSPGNHYLSVIGRLAPGVSLAQARDQLAALSAWQTEEHSRYHRGWSARLDPLHEDVVGHSANMLYILMGAAALVLLIACVNVANLFLARNAARQRELAIRSALGSGRGRLLRLLLAESLAVAALGGAAGLVLACRGVDVLLALTPDSLPRAQEISANATLFFFALGVTVLTGILTGLVPAWQLTAPTLDRMLRETAGTSSGGLQSRRMRSLLVTAQVALALVLLIGAGLLIRSFLELQRVDLGITAQHVTTLKIHLPDSSYGEPWRRVAFHHAFADRLRAVPGVEAVGAISKLPVSGRFNTWSLRYRSADGEVTYGDGDFRIVDGDYFQALGIDLRAGRLFDRSDGADSPPVVILNETAARHFFADRDPLNEEILSADRWWRVVAIVRDAPIDHRGTAWPKIYLPHSQFALRNWALTQVIASTRPAGDLLALARRELAAIDGSLVVHNVRSMRQVTARAVAGERFAFLLMGLFAAVALSLAAVGIYGVLACSANQRTRELGIRMALGADSWDVRWTVLRQGAILAAAGVAAGWLAAFALSRLLGSMLFGVGVTDPLVFALVPLVVVSMVGLASFFPAHRVAGIHPTEALRHE